MIEKIVQIPEGVSVTITNKQVFVKGPKGELNRDFFSPRYENSIFLEKKDDKIKIYSKTDRKEFKSMIGTITAHIKNMIRGVCEGFEYILKIHYVHFPMSVEIKDNIVYIKNFLGERGPRTARIIGDTKVTVKKDEVIVSSIDREAAGKTAANIEQACRISRRDRRVFQDGIYIAKKPGRKFGDA